MIPLKLQVKQTFEFIRKSRYYFFDVLIVHLLMLFVLLPLLSQGLKGILKFGGIPYLSSDNLLEIVTQHGFVLLGMIILLVIMLCLVYFEFTFLILSFAYILEQKIVTVPQLFFQSLKVIQGTTFSKLLFFLTYFLILLPLSGLGFHSELISKIKIPAFILDFIFQQRYLVVSSFLLLYLVTLYLAIRFILVLPYLVLENTTVLQALKKSWAKTKQRFLSLGSQIAFLYLAVLLLVAFLYLVTVSTQQLVDSHFPQIARSVASVLLSALYGLSLGQSTFLSALLIYLMVSVFRSYESIHLPQNKNFWASLEKKSVIYVRNFFFVLGLIAVGVTEVLGNYQELEEFTFTKPTIASHRGVDLSKEANGVQNSLEALENTAKLQPNFVEMDVFLTKDQQFVVVHDENLKKLTGENMTIDQLTLAQATKLTVKENNLSSKIVSFTDYLNEAEKLKQPLLVEIKVTKNDPKNLVSLFLKKYEKELQQNHAYIQSLSYNIVEEIKKQAPDLVTGYVLPFNIIGPPSSSADFFTMEHTTLNKNFVEAAKKDGKFVLAWTVNDVSTMERMVFYGVSGIITDKVATMKKALLDQPEEATYADKLLYFWIGMG